MISALGAGRRRRDIAVGVIAAMVVGTFAGVPADASAARRVTSSLRATDGITYTATNHLTAAAAHRHKPRRYLLVWAGAENPRAPDFLAVLDATPGGVGYGKVLNTVTLGPRRQNEPHHMQYVWHKGDRLFAGGILSDTVYVFDTSTLPILRLVGVNTPGDTPCGSAPDAFTVLRDGTAYATYMGGPDVSGPCRYTNGEVRDGNGYAGSPGQVVLMDDRGRTIAEIPAATAEGEDPALCTNIPALPRATCANPHGVQVREDLNRMVVSDFGEIRNYLNVSEPSEDLFDPGLVRDTVRIFDISNRRNPELVSVSHLPAGPRAAQEPFAVFAEDRIVMENAVTNLPQHRGAFASTMWGGAIFYTPDITAPQPQWREVFDDSTAYAAFRPPGSTLSASGGDGGGWLGLSPDDRYLFHTVVGTQIGVPLDVTTGMVYVLDVRALLAAGDEPTCSIDTMAEVTAGGAEPDCPALVSVLPVRDVTTGGPHWAALDNFTEARGGGFTETRRTSRLAVANYFLSAVNFDGDHRVCVVNVARDGALSMDRRFRDERSGAPCANFNRARWPHGATGNARPHGVLFAADPWAIR